MIVVCYDENMSDDGSDTGQRKISEQEIELIARTARELARSSEGDYYRYVDQQAVIDGMRSSELAKAVRTFNKEWRFGQNRDKIRFYHATSMKSLGAILKCGELLSRRERSVRGEDLTALPWSSSENLQFTYDSFGPRGELRESGLGMGSGAAGSDLSFMFDGSLMDEPSFDATTIYPSVEKVNIADRCLGILVRDDVNIDRVTEMLKENNIDIPVYSSRKYDIRVATKQPLETEKRLVVEQVAAPEQEKNNGTELLRETEIRGVIKMLEGLEGGVERLSTIARGNQSTEESAEALKDAIDTMKVRSEDYLATMQNGRGLGEVLTQGGEYAKSMEEELGFAMRALDILRKRVESLPSDLADAFMNDVQQIESNTRMAYGIVVRKRSVEI